MPIRYEIYQESGMIRTTGFGVLTDADMMAHKYALLADQRFRTGMRELVDICGVQSLEVSPEGVSAMAAFDAEHQPELQTHQLALLVCSELAFGIGRMYEMASEGNTAQVRVFGEESEALRWLNGKEVNLLH